MLPVHRAYGIMLSCYMSKYPLMRTRIQTVQSRVKQPLIPSLLPVRRRQSYQKMNEQGGVKGQLVEIAFTAISEHGKCSFNPSHFRAIVWAITI